MLHFKGLLLAATALAGLANAAPAAPVNAKPGDVIPGRYIVSLKKDAGPRLLGTHLDWVGGIHARALGGAVDVKGIERTFNGSYGFQGYAGAFDDATVKEIRNNPDVDSVEEDRVWEISWLDEQQQQHVEKRDEFIQQQNATWGLASVSHRAPGASDYRYHELAGEDTYAYVIDTGVRVTHEEFEGRAVHAWTAFDSNEDNVGHGTHVAGTIGGKTWGVSKKANILAVKIFNERSSTTSTILAGFDWAVNDIISKGRQKKSALNMSLGGFFSLQFNMAVERAADKDVLSIVAAGNENSNAALTSPASARSAVTVAAIDREWKRAFYSNYGSVVDIFAPGSNITSAWNTSDTAEKIISGTSMATPHVVGLALYAMSVDGVGGVKDVTDHLISVSTMDKVQDPRGTPNRIGNNNNPYQ